MGTILNNPAATLRHLEAERLAYLKLAVHWADLGQTMNCTYCKGKASGLDDAIALLGGERISLSIADYRERLAKEA